MRAYIDDALVLGERVCGLRRAGHEASLGHSVEVKCSADPIAVMRRAAIHALGNREHAIANQVGLLFVETASGRSFALGSRRQGTRTEVEASAAAKALSTGTTIQRGHLLPARTLS